ncbi:MAG TPA: zinc ribbon domain-containing protein [Bryobacteraceae bacterium]|nr:zinc ribbon domain-containing protein [Bryobacteraceae bacterium]
MFTWICPKCGREVPPAYTDCPNCNPQSLPAAAAPPPQSRPAAPPQQPAAPPQPPAYAAPPQQPGAGRRRPIWQSTQAGAPPEVQPEPPAYAPPQPAYTEPLQQYAPPQSYAPAPPEPPPAQPYYAPSPEPPAPPAPPLSSWNAPPPPKAGMPTWMMIALSTLGFAVLVSGIYWLVGSHSSSPAASAAQADTSIPAPPPSAKDNPFLKFIEISGMRFAEDPKDKAKTVVKFVITNHSDDEVHGLSGTVAIVARGDKTGQPVAGFTFVTSLGPEEAKDLTTALDTKLKPYELPDWQYAQPMLQITAPGGASSNSQ